MPLTERTADRLSKPKKLSAVQVYRPTSSRVTLCRCSRLACEMSSLTPFLLQDSDGGGIPLAMHSTVTLLLSRIVSFSPTVRFTDTRCNISCSFVENKILGLTGSGGQMEKQNVINWDMKCLFENSDIRFKALNKNDIQEGSFFYEVIKSMTQPQLTFSCLTQS